VEKYLPPGALMTLWTAVHLGVSPASETIHSLDEWQIGLIYEIAMNYPVESLRRSYWKRKTGVESLDEESLTDDDMGYTLEEAAAIKGRA
jgi:hypothetical protein